MKRIVILAVLILLGISALGWTQNRYYAIHKEKYITIKGGYYMLSGKSDLWEYNEELLTLSVKDLNNFNGALELGFPVDSRFDISLEFGFYKDTAYTEYRDFIDEWGDPITQQISLRIVPIMFNGKFYPIAKTSRKNVRGRTEYRSIAPYVGAGLGLYIWRYEELGDYIDFSDGSIYTTQFLTNGTDLGVNLRGGIEIPIGSSAAIMAEFSHHIIKGELSEDFVGFQKFDLGGNLFSFGFVFHY
jgi:hypothetical protein